MSACTGREITTEVLGHLRLQQHGARILETCTCIPCMIPFIASQFLPRSKGDRPPIILEGSKNLAFVGQYCELPDDVVFTVEYSQVQLQYLARERFHFFSRACPQLLFRNC